MADQGPPNRTLRLTPGPNAQPETDDQLSIELDAIITIGRALSHIPDAETRARVMRWAIERFGIDMTAAAEPGGDLDVPANIMPANAPQEHSGESLTLDGLSELFRAADEEVPHSEQEYTLSRSRERKRAKASAAARLRDALHWMGL